MTALEQSLLSDIPRLNADSQAFVRWILDRVIGIGLASYGPWSATNDHRDLDKEIADELADAVVYTGMRAVMRALRKQDRVRRFRDAHQDSSTPSDRLLATPQAERVSLGVDETTAHCVAELGGES
jgi:hypothetical protein